MTPRPGAKRRALAEEQAHADRVHDRVEQLRRRAEERAVAAGADHSGSTFQARFERDVTAHHHASRAARFTFGDVEALVFGRMDLADGETLHVGRVSVVDEDREVLLVDWRAPASAAFYRATAAEPLRVARRRTLTTRGAEVRDLDDELLDADAADRLGLEAVTGQGALLAALSRVRDGRMHDIVATIQADQDRIIRSRASGTLVVTGGPGTGKTVVALHRVAYLLYDDRERFEGRGILVVGPSRAFAEYTSRVLPALGEDRAVQRPLTALAPVEVETNTWDEPDVAAIKGSLAMVEVCRQLVVAVLPPLPPVTRFAFQGTSVEVSADRLRTLRGRLLSRVTADRDEATYHARRDGAGEALRAALWQAWRRAHDEAGGHPPDERTGTGFDTALDESPQVRMLRRCWWPELDPETVLADLALGRVDLGEVAGGLLPASDVATLRSAWDVADGWTVDDVALLDEVGALLGSPPPRARQAARDDEGIRLTSDELTDDIEPLDVADPDYRDFAHVVVDEAQDLTPLQWRAVARRGPYASWTVVGDLAQRSRVADPATWDDVAALIGRREVTVTELQINYRTPSEVVSVARAVLEAAGHDPDAVPQAVRATGERPRLVRADDVAETAVAVSLSLAEDREGMVAVVCPPSWVDDLTGRLEVRGQDRPELVERIRAFDPYTIKGLEFDDVVVAAPDAIASGSVVGLHLLYVSVTRATRSLTMVATPDAHVPGADHCDEA